MASCFQAQGCRVCIWMQSRIRSGYHFMVLDQDSCAVEKCSSKKSLLLAPLASPALPHPASRVVHLPVPCGPGKGRRGCVIAQVIWSHPLGQGEQKTTLGDFILATAQRCLHYLSGMHICVFARDF